ncbi:MAG TPA: phosphatase PAP2 family protein [Casimicrobiaceae bacterium]|jgi:undecaprenyl-diphosphatase|nr:phosphatase PAP2 family protein [Casimicrobiaceae bacterium]
MARVRPAGLFLSLGFMLAASSASAGFDHKVGFDDSGIWNHNVEQSIMYTMIGLEVGTGLWEGGESRLGKTSWQAMDSTAAGALLATAGKYIFTRSRPNQTDDPNQWFQGKGHYSFPSGEVTTYAAIVTPYILEYNEDHPAVWALALLPVYSGITRIKNQAHWQTDVLASWALGGLTGYWAHKRDNPIILSVMPHSVFVGLKTQF